MIKTLLLSGLTICGLTQIRPASAGAAQSPFRFRINKNALTKIVNLRDQDAFKAFEDILVSEDAGFEHVKSITFSLKPEGVPLEDFDLAVHMTKEYLGAESDKVAVKGTVTLQDGTEVPFTAPVPLVKIQYALGTVFNPDYKIDQLKFEEKEWTFKTGDVVAEGLSAEARAEVAAAIDAHVDTFKKKFEMGDKKGEMDFIKNFPMDTVIPMAGLYYASNFAESVEFDDTFATLGFSLQHWKMLTEKQSKMLKEIKHDFSSEKNKDGYDALAQFTIDDNLFNSFATVFTSVDKTFSVREILKQNPKSRPWVGHMKTQILASVFPSFADKYGSDGNFDVMISPSHALFLDGFPNSKMSGLYIDKNGNWKLQVNIPLTIMVQTPDKQWDDARQVYITAVFKFKIAVNEVNASTKKFSLTPKNFEVTNLKILQDGNEEEMEQMMVQSFLNIQNEGLKKEFKELPFYLSDILAKNPKELQCLGFNIADLDVSFKKSQVQVSAYYKETKYQNQAVCEQFLAELRESPNKIFNQFMSNENLMRGIKEAQSLSAGNKTANPFEAIGDMSKIAKSMEAGLEHDEL